MRKRVAMTVAGADLFGRFSEVFLSDDIDGFMELVDDECVW
jgi:hypothetical protein